MSSPDVVDLAQAEAHRRLEADHAALAVARTHRFLVAQSSLLGIATGLVVVSVLAGVVDGILFAQSVTFCLFVAIITGLGWYLFRRHEATTRLVTALLYVDVVVGMFFFYVGGEFETPFLSVILLPIMMAPLFTGKTHAYGLATVAACMYMFLVGARWFDLLPYGYLLPRAALRDPSFIADSVMGFLTVVYGTALLAGAASFEILTSQRELEVAVERQTGLLAHANRVLQEQNRALDQFNAELSHDLRSPLQTALLNAELLRQGNPPLSPTQAHLADGLVESVARMGELIRELLRLARMEVNADTLESVSLEAVVAAARADLASFLDLTGGQVRVDGDLPHARGSASLLRELVQNLIENGVKYGDPAGPHVRIASATAPPGRVAVAIEDDGPGVPVVDRERIFRPFVRLDRDRNRDGGGHGLAIAHRIVTAHGGTIRVESGQTLAGARFVVELPGS